MPTVIDELIVKLGLDAKEYKKTQGEIVTGQDKLKKGIEKNSRDIEAAGKKAASYFTGLKTAAVAFFAAITAGRGLIDFASGVMKTGMTLTNMSQNLGMSVEMLSKFSRASELVGGTQQGFIQSAAQMNAEMTDFTQTGQSKWLPFMQQLGVSWTDAQGKAKDFGTFIGDISKSIESKHIARPQAYGILKQMGLDEGSINLILSGSSQMKKLVDAQQGYTKKQAQAAMDMEQKWIRVQQHIESLTRALIIKLAPAIEKAMNGFSDFADKAIPAVSTIIDWLKDADKATDGWSTKILGLLGVLRLVGGTGIISGLAGVITKLALIGTTAETAAGAAGAGAAGAAGGGLMSGVGALLARLGVVGSIFYSSSLNTGEQDEINKRILDDPSTPEAIKEKIRAAMKDSGGYAESTTTEAKGGTIAARLNNPGNLRFAGQSGATKDQSGFAKFNDVASGYAAMSKQLMSYYKRGLNTVSEIVSKYAPSNENDTVGYANYVAQDIGVGKDQEIDVSNPYIMRKLLVAMSKREGGANADYINNANIQAGMQAAGMKTGMATAANNGMVTSSQGNTVTIGQVVVNTQATDARGVARELHHQIVAAESGAR